MRLSALVFKELRQLTPLALGLTGILLWTAASSLIFDPPDQQGWAALSWLADPTLGRLSAWFTLGLGVITAYNLLPGEHDSRTIEFLYTLPVRRRTLFLVKYLVGSGLLAAFSMLGTAVGWLQHSLNPGSFEQHQLRGSFMAIEWAADLALPFIAVAYGLVLAFFRRLGWVLMLLVWLTLELAERVSPPLQILNIKAMLEVEHHGTQPLIRWGAWQLHGLLAAGALLLAGRLWLVQPEVFTAFYQRLTGHKLARRLALGLGMLVLALIAVSLMVSQGGDGGDDVPDQPVRSLDTEHFQFSYHPAEEVQARFIGREADEAYRRVRERLGAPPVQHIVADLTETSDHHLGIAGWKKMRLDIRPPKSDGLLRHVLYHETTHVLAAAVAEQLSGERDAEARFFAEGLAEWVTYQLLGPAAAGAPRRDEARQIAGLAHRRFRLRFQDLLDPEAFLARHDEYLLYALGEVWVAALVETCGASAPAKVLRAFGRAAGPQRLGGGELWRNTLQGAGCDLDRVVGRYEQHLRAQADDAAGVPVAGASLVGQHDGQLLFQLSVQSPATTGQTPWRVTVRVREDPDTPPDQVIIRTVTWAPGTAAPIAVPAPPGTGRRIQFQVGARARAEAPALFSRWQTSTLVGG
jgi:hypothetical protein